MASIVRAKETGAFYCFNAGLVHIYERTAGNFLHLPVTFMAAFPTISDGGSHSGGLVILVNDVIRNGARALAVDDGKADLLTSCSYGGGAA
jgi:hypothetical protein